MKKLTKDVYMEVLFFAFVLGIWLLWAFILPLNEGPDENMRLQIAQFILKYGKLPTGDQKEIMDYTWGFTYAFRPILPQMLEALFMRIAMVFTRDAVFRASGQCAERSSFFLVCEGFGGHAV